MQGRDSIRAAIAPALADGGSLAWSPVRAELSASGDLAYTVGRFERRAPGADEPDAVSTGQYVTIWRKDPGGSWKVVLGVGAPDPS